MSTAKRTCDHLHDEQPRAKRIHPFFTNKLHTEPSTGSFRWLEPLGPSRSCLHGVNYHPTPSVKVAAFDLDGTLIKSDYGGGKKPSETWEWWRTSVPAKLKEVADSGYAVVIISNQALKPQALKAWKAKIPLIAAALPNVPFHLFAATAKDGYRKPMPGMWTELVRIYREGGIEIDRAQSFFVGDAAGRQYAGNKHDFSSTDRKWALNIDIPFFTPEEYFLKLAPHTNYTLPGFNVSSLPSDLPHILPTSTPLLPVPPTKELVLFVGYPCLGKSTFYRRHFEPAGYVHINQDTLKTRERCIRETRKILQEGKSCVVGKSRYTPVYTLYRCVSSRQHQPEHYDSPILSRRCERSKCPNEVCVVTIFDKRDGPMFCRCFYFTGSMELAWHNNLYRAYNLPPSVSAGEPERELVPYVGFTGFRDNFEEPKIEEGFSEIKKVNWVFEGSEEERAYWTMWLQIDGK